MAVAVGAEVTPRPIRASLIFDVLVFTLIAPFARSFM